MGAGAPSLQPPSPEGPPWGFRIPTPLSASQGGGVSWAPGPKVLPPSATFCQPRRSGCLIIRSLYPRLARQLSPNIWPRGPRPGWAASPHLLLALTPDTSPRTSEPAPLPASLQQAQNSSRRGLASLTQRKHLTKLTPIHALQTCTHAHTRTHCLQSRSKGSPLNQIKGGEGATGLSFPHRQCDQPCRKPRGIERANV